MTCPSWRPSGDCSNCDGSEISEMRFVILTAGSSTFRIRDAGFHGMTRRTVSKRRHSEIGTRGSALALTQSAMGGGPHPGAPSRVRRWSSSPSGRRGTSCRTSPWSRSAGKGLFIKEIEEALLRGDVDLAVHSMKDVPAELPEALEIAVTPLREDPRDVLISRDNRKLEEMPRGARIGTCSLRRGFQLRNRMPDLEIVPLRGNLDTRIRKIETEGLDGVIVAAAGIRRMGWVGQGLPVHPRGGDASRRRPGGSRDRNAAGRRPRPRRRSPSSTIR